MAANGNNPEQKMPVHQTTLSWDTHQTLRRIAIFFAMMLSGGNLVLPRIPLLIIVLGICFLLRGHTFGLRKEMLGIGALLFCIIAATTLGSGTFDPTSIATRCANFMAGISLLGLYLTEPRGTIFRDLRPIFQFMSLQAIGTIILAKFLPLAFWTFTFTDYSLSNVTYYTFLGIFTYHVTVADASMFVRPDGFFWEPGVFQIYLNIFLFISVFITKRRFDIAIASIAIVSLQSTTGLLIALMIAGVVFAQWFIRAAPSGKIIAVALAPLLIAPLLFIAIENFTAKTSGVLQGSSWARAYDFYTGVNVIMAHPLLGVGFDHERYRLEAAKRGYADTQLDYSSSVERSSSNGLIALIASIGIPLSLPFLVAIFRQRFFPKPLLFGMVLALSFTGAPLMLTPFFLMLLFSAMLLGKRPIKRSIFLQPPKVSPGYLAPAPFRS